MFEWIVIKYAKLNIEMRQTYIKSIWNIWTKPTNVDLISDDGKSERNLQM